MIDEKLLIEKLETLKERFDSFLGNNIYLGKKEMGQFFDKLIEEIESMKNNDKLWCEEYQDYYGNSDPKYGGTLTDLRKLPVGTKFLVANGLWAGEILSDNRILVHAPTGDFIVELTDGYHSLYLR